MQLFEAFFSPASFGPSLKCVEQVQQSFTSLARSTWRSGSYVLTMSDIEDLNEMYGPLCLQRYDHDLGGHKNQVGQYYDGVQLQGTFTCFDDDR